MKQGITIRTAEITKGDGSKPTWNNCDGSEETPHGIASAHRWQSGWYAIDKSGETGNAWAWVGPYATEGEAIAAIEGGMTPASIQGID